jgi:hypothetical protein
MIWLSGGTRNDGAESEPNREHGQNDKQNESDHGVLHECRHRSVLTHCSPFAYEWQPSGSHGGGCVLQARHGIPGPLTKNSVPSSVAAFRGDVLYTMPAGAATVSASVSSSTRFSIRMRLKVIARGKIGQIGRTGMIVRSAVWLQVAESRR